MKNNRIYDPAQGSLPCLHPSAYLHLFRARCAPARGREAWEVLKFVAESLAWGAVGALAFFAILTLAFSL